MTDADRFRLLGRYRTPRFRYGSSVSCEVRGEVVLTGLTNGLIPWPIGKRPGGRAKALVVFAGLADAVRRESATAICHWWGISAQSVSKWRSVMGVGSMTEGTTRLKAQSAAESPALDAARERGKAMARDPERVRKIAQAKLGKPRPDHVIEAMRRGRLGRPHSPETRKRMSEAHKKRVRGPRKGWDDEQDGLLGELPDAKVAGLTGRSVVAVVSRRNKLGIGRYEE